MCDAVVISGRQKHAESLHLFSDKTARKRGLSPGHHMGAVGDVKGVRVWHRACKGGMQHRALTPEHAESRRQNTAGIVPGGVCVVGKRRGQGGVAATQIHKNRKGHNTKSKPQTSKTDTQENRARLNCGIAEQPSLKSERASEQMVPYGFAALQPSAGGAGTANACGGQGMAAAGQGKGGIKANKAPPPQ